MTGSRFRILTIVVMGMFAVGAVGSAYGAWLGWRGVPALPGDSQVIATVAAAGLDTSRASTTRQDDIFGYQPPLTIAIDKVLVPTLGTDGYGPGHVAVTVRGVTQPLEALAAARAALSRDGWRVDPIADGVDGRSFDALKGATLSTWTAVLNEDADGVELDTFQPVLQVTVARGEPDNIRWFIVCGWLAGAALGAVLALIVLARRGTSRSHDTKAVAIGLGLMFPATALTTLENVAYVFLAHPHPFAVKANWDWYTYIGVRPLAAVGAIALLVAVVRRAWPSCPGDQSSGVR
jgi:hypothetical protein